VTGTLACHAAASDAIELVMHEGDELIERRPIATAPCEEQFSKIAQSAASPQYRIRLSLGARSGEGESVGPDEQYGDGGDP
jgi:hypothetical protein